MPTFVKSSVPLYAQLEAALRENIRRGVWGPGDPLPSDRDLAAQWRVSRCTVRQALDALVRDGLIERRQGKGTFVSPGEVLRDFIGFYTLGDVDGQGKDARLTSRVISFQSVDPPEPVRERLKVMPGTQVIQLKLVRLANQKPVLLLSSYMPPEVCSGLKGEDFLTYPVLTEVITNVCRIPIVSQRRSVRSILIEGEDAELLGVEPGALGLLMERISYTDFRQPVECGYTLVRGDRCSYTIDIGRTRGRLGLVAHDRGSLWQVEAAADTP